MAYVQVASHTRLGQAIIDARHVAQAEKERMDAEEEALLDYIMRVLELRGFTILAQHLPRGTGLGDSWDRKAVSHMFKVDDTSVAIGVQVGDGGRVTSYLMSHRSNGGYEKAGAVETYDDLAERLRTAVTLVDP